MANLHGFDANEVDPQLDLDPIPAGKYVAVITASEMSPNKAGNGAFLKLTFQVIEGPFEGRMVWARLNLDNPNPQAVTIARAELSAICRAVGVMQPNDSEDLHDLPLIITVKCRKREDTGEITNEIRGYSSRNEERSTPPSTPPTKPTTSKPGSSTSTTATQSKNSIPPWKR
ncbi:DUF669 domain-containing protein [Tuwongella immobilis]|uniref:DUF669 domain-containing protein n=1 Tax=Tuwongella immobilis TaxID=692036 RepID=A0A6C2YN99_9BACT|nr:DUF669 domain-containing protein [Tuwongella immobilis]VIP03088.1 Uncharacterized protein OS=Isosphaera pallida (strain ATCC 43644 / DSM 9630 / IS1B) GN=Isop_2441 PE=4 SV=1: DUF669 [Tuwongella immobilis]VTS03351.1 Uncharacterized protein OS=Isosphaera pallida (strain ATCC 43644 / DSM 9630 / IS1B) GN=Isop_2441 PE=4 SV=1: DUF669 [Tuwongella immobilis]